jgi:pyruvate/2-oxoglutarate dehydrogenase complex dihydrolipoamide acyltransferase (E2) component
MTKAHRQATAAQAAKVAATRRPERIEVRFLQGFGGLLRRSTVKEVLVSPSDRVNEGEVLIKVESNIAALEFEARSEAVVLEVNAAVGDEIPDDTLLLVLEQERLPNKPVKEQLLAEASFPNWSCRTKMMPPFKVRMLLSPLSGLEKALLGMPLSEDPPVELRDGAQITEALEFLSRARAFFQREPQQAEHHERAVLAAWEAAEGKRVVFHRAVEEMRSVLRARILAGSERERLQEAVATQLDDLSLYLAVSGFPPPR